MIVVTSGNAKQLLFYGFGRQCGREMTQFRISFQRRASMRKLVALACKQTSMAKEVATSTQ